MTGKLGVPEFIFVSSFSGQHLCFEVTFFNKKIYNLAGPNFCCLCKYVSLVTKIGFYCDLLIDPIYPRSTFR